MSNITDVSIGGINIKEIVPKSSKVDFRIFSNLMDEKSASYKMYWLLGILDEVSEGNTEIEFNRLISRMIIYAWYPIMKYKLNFGYSDNLKRIVNYIALKYNISDNCDEKKLLDFIYTSEDSVLKKMMYEITLNVPYRLLAPFFSEEIKGQKGNFKNNNVAKLSLESSTCLYKIVKKTKNKIIINHGWEDYLKENYGVIKYWIYYKLIEFLQKRNPNVPAIAFKLEAPRSRNLKKATKLWNQVIVAKGINDIYTKKEFTSGNYKIYGVLSIDHFIPWSFVLHDEMWNLVPTFKNINSKKSDKLLTLKDYIEDFCNIQYKAFSYLCENKMDKDLESYVEGLKINEPYNLIRYSGEEEFSRKLVECISPLHQIAMSQGFDILIFNNEYNIC